MERPALKRLLQNVEAGEIDCVVVYKVDRLSRSLLDFSRIVETFDKHGFSFVAVTQQFNTTNSLGRLTLNILLSFAQFEREIIAERMRDKMCAARKKDKWIGGHPLLGYDIDSGGGRILINPTEAEHVREIFRLYRSKVIATIARMIGRPEDAEDVTQEVFTRLYFTRKNLREPAAFEIWLHRMTVNAAYDYLRGPRGCSNRREARVAEVPETQLALMDALAGRRAQLEEREHERVRELVQELLGGVSEADRILLILREVEGLSLQDMENIYKTNQNALKVRLFRARQRVLKAFHNQRDPQCGGIQALRRAFVHAE